MITIEYNNKAQIADLVLNECGNLQDDLETTLETAVLISLFTEARDEDLEIDEVGEPLLGTYKGGWWGDSFSDFPWGSKLWRLKRSVLSVTTLQRARKFAADSLEWMINDNVATSIEVESFRGGQGLLCLRISILTPGNDSPFIQLWKVKLDAL